MNSETGMDEVHSFTKEKASWAALILFKDLFILMCMGVLSACVCAACVRSTHRCQRRAMNPLELKVEL